VRWLGQLTGFAAALSLAFIPTPSPASSPDPVLIRATQSGQRTLDQGEGGGNPFASAFIELLARRDLDLRAFSGQLVARTRTLSDGFQTPDVPPDIGALPVNLGRAAPGERRMAMVLVMSAYGPGLPGLPGAARDAQRVRTALQRAGFRTRLELDLARGQVGAALARFASASANADVALIYTTGHGIEVDGVGYLLQRDFAPVLGLYGLGAYGIPLRRIAGSMRARSVNLLFYAGCRDNPFAQSQ
jgi:hypothetical protein